MTKMRRFLAPTVTADDGVLDAVMTILQGNKRAKTLEKRGDGIKSSALRRRQPLNLRL